MISEQEQLEMNAWRLIYDLLSYEWRKNTFAKMALLRHDAIEIRELMPSVERVINKIGQYTLYWDAGVLP